MKIFATDEIRRETLLGIPRRSLVQHSERASSHPYKRIRGEGMESALASAREVLEEVSVWT